MSEQLELAVTAPQLAWSRPKGRHACGRDPMAGPGSCALWWEGCPKAEKRGCYRLWAKSDAVLNHWASQAPQAWTDAPEDLPPVSAGHLRDKGLIEIREPEDARWQWRRAPTEKDRAA